MSILGTKIAVFGLSTVMTLATAEGAARLVGLVTKVNFGEFHRAMEIIDNDDRFATAQFKQACGYLATTLETANTAYLNQLISAEIHASRMKRCHSVMLGLRAG